MAHKNVPEPRKPEPAKDDHTNTPVHGDTIIELGERPGAPEQAPRKRGEGSIFQRGNTWWICYYRRGKRIRESSYSTNREHAEKMLARKSKQLWAEKQGLQAFV